MKNKSIITISTIYGTRGFHFEKWHSQFLKITAAVFLLVILAVAFNLSYLTQKVDQVSAQEDKLKQHSSTLQSTIENLNSENKDLEQDLEYRDSLISDVSTRLDEIEQYLETDSYPASLSSEKDSSFDLRLNIAAVNSAVRISLLESIPNGAPVKNARLSSRFGYRTHPVTNKKKRHNGLDFAVNTGTPVYATADGVVEIARKSNAGSGNFIRLQHGFGFTSSFSHLSAFKVKNGDFVEKGQLLAKSGNTGLSSGPHLHYEVRFIGRALDPLSFVKWDNNNFDSIFEKEKAVKWEFLVKKVERQISSQLQLLSQVDAELLVQSN
ncbi:M23 family metallopeptidase [Psychromonas ossibalaenae]|uniref:M23 family metallopeptidase n=1 Tax=Psychromonas ossibalaenae TaxID=444922 RepID=UPI00035C92D1|nr:M23 family metallopeptidase [Psychromonas ossibalaenae]